MISLEEFFASVGSDASAVIGRLGGNSALIMRFLAMFRADTSYDELCTAFDNDNTEAAFRAAHKLKGVAGTLGFQSLYDQASSVTEMLRGGDLASAKVARPELEKAYAQVLEALKNINL